MRSPHSFTVVCRRPGGEIVVRENAWQPLWKNIRPLRWPALRGAVVLFEALWNGLSALSFAAAQQDPSTAAGTKPEASDRAGKAGLMAISLLLALVLFVGTPHLFAWGLGNLLGFSTADLWFHLADGVAKTAILIGYMAAISLLPDVRRVFAYHGAEHKAIFTYEKGLPLTVDNARAQSRFHPRCGTSFLLIVILVSIALFAAVLRGRLSDSAPIDHVAKILLKVPLMLPIAGLAYEIIKLSGRAYATNRLARLVAAPGLWLQNITTREPSDDQLEIALISIRKTLWRERSGEIPGPSDEGAISVFASAAEVDLPIA